MLFSWALPGRVRRDPIIFGPGLESLREEFDECGLAFWQVFLRPGTFRLAVPRGCLCSPVGSLGSESWGTAAPRAQGLHPQRLPAPPDQETPKPHARERKEACSREHVLGREVAPRGPGAPSPWRPRSTSQPRGAAHALSICPSVHPGEGGHVYPQRRQGLRPATVVLPCRVFAVGSPCFMRDDLASVWL